MQDLESCSIEHKHPEAVQEAKAALPEEVDALELTERFEALADPSRFRMLLALSTGELCVCDLAEVAGLSQSATSHHLRNLKKARLVSSRRDGNVVYYRIADGLLQQLIELARGRFEQNEKESEAEQAPEPARRAG